MSKIRPKDGWKRGRDSKYVLTVRFISGPRSSEPMTYYSDDWDDFMSEEYKPKLGLEKLNDLKEKHINKSLELFLAFNDSFNPKKRTLIEYYKNGHKKNITPELIAKLQI